MDPQASGGGKVVLITGATSGIGLTCARQLAARGHRVFGTGRSARDPIDGIEMLPMDVTRDDDAERVVAHIEGVASRIDVLVNNAGFGIAGAIEDTSPDEARAQLETNVLGPLRMCRAVLPGMRARGAGLIVNVSSIAGLVPVPFQGWYSASKAALESMSEALRMEVQPFGVRVALIEPGDFSTGFTGSRVRVAAATDASPYATRFARALAVFERDERAAPPPDAVARTLVEIVERDGNKFRHSVGAVLQRTAPALRQLLPTGVYERLMMQTYDIHR